MITGPEERRQVAIGLVRRLRKAGHEAYFAGGCVRDACLGLHPKDYDIATSALPERVASLLPRCQMVGKAFGVVLSRPTREVSVEVATFRTDGTYSDGRRPDSVSFTSAQGDAQRRDFTINGLFSDPLSPEADGSDRIIDFVGGLNDLKSGTLRAIGDPNRRFGEDFLRLLRAVRFAARLNFRIESATWEAMRRHAPALDRIARERIGDEVRRIVTGPRAALGAHLLEASGLAAACLQDPALPPSQGTRLPHLEGHALYVTRLTAWMLDMHLHPDMPRMAQWRYGLHLTNQEYEQLSTLTRLLEQFMFWPDMSVSTRKRVLANPLSGQALLLLQAERHPICGPIAVDATALASDGIGISPKPYLSGHDLLTLGLAASPQFKIWLEEAYDLQLCGILSTREQSLAWARERMTGNS